MINFLLVSLLIFPIISVLAFLGSRLLGGRVSFPCALLTALLGLLAALGLIITLKLLNAWFPVTAFALALLLTMVGMVFTELLAPPGSLGRIQDRLVHNSLPIRALYFKCSRIYRYLQICFIGARHGLSFSLGNATNRTPSKQALNSSLLAKGLKSTLQDAGGVFVKLGQVLSTRQDLLPPAMITELSTLQDHVPPVPYERIVAVFQKELGGTPSELFAQFDPEPLASASIAQVYRAQLHSGEQVVIKVQRPGMRRNVERDIDILLRLSQTLELHTAWGRQLQTTRLAKGFAEALLEELDFQVEGRNLLALSDALKNHAAIVIPKLYQHLSTSRILVMEWLDGVSVRHAETAIHSPSEERTSLARSLLNCFLYQILGNGVFHADPHPGNILLLREGKLALIDLGSVGRLDPLQQSALRSMLFAIQRNDAHLLSQAILDIAEVGEDMQEERFERALAQYLVQRLGSHMPFDARAIADLFLLIQKFEVSFPPVVAGVFRALVTLENALHLLCPGFSLVDEARTLAVAYVKEELQPTALSNVLINEALTLLPILRRLPRRLDRITASLERGNFVMNTRLFAHPADAAFIRVLISNIILAFLGATLGIMGVLLITMNGGSTVLQKMTVLQGLGYISLGISAIFIMRVVMTVAHDQTRYRS
ncbi:ubiquinone biosynthesis protein UbiB [Ktedonobacter sp. SOSP1-52]|uniref:ABC1 kinase family protein n=1 Tax=Ktedonobacter sp. SOSP1-52 TaxID=2778366 RepID=UPI001915CA50|nr:AarF/ABC1/UbiB kinase family protein [Ktedonobacter sp. SOSP1-52]GHO65485.1 ubiquinone biosynthesis protein UbiB [Ktedonobacter sp. SOSP1-52]